MIDIQWKGKIGYGDIVSPICYAHNVSYKLQESVSLTFRWDKGYDHKVHPSDPEPLYQRASYIDMLCDKEGTDVTVLHKFNSPLDINHTNYDWNIVGKDKFHNFWMPTTIVQDHNPNLIVVNSTAGNVVSLKEYGKPWKDPIGDKWDYVIKLIQQNYRVEVVDYRTPVVELVRLLRSAKAFVGYHGTAAWVAKFMLTPSILFADGGSLTRNAFPYATIINDTSSLRKTISNLDTFIDDSITKTTKALAEYEDYFPSLEFIDHLHHD